ncbi:recombinase family protein [Nocardia grenadensis]|uniref:recombinase family protein n=1 Tax=Nocardia grenadensis TaxID=931537 RepID=UPI0035A22E47
MWCHRWHPGTLGEAAMPRQTVTSASVGRTFNGHGETFVWMCRPGEMPSHSACPLICPLRGGPRDRNSHRLCSLLRQRAGPYCPAAYAVWPRSRRRRIYLDHGFTGIRRTRPNLDQALAAVRVGDTLLAPELDRLARSVPDAREIGDSLVARGVKLSLGGAIYDPRWWRWRRRVDRGPGRRTAVRVRCRGTGRGRRGTCRARGGGG